MTGEATSLSVSTNSDHAQRISAGAYTKNSTRFGTRQASTTITVDHAKSRRTCLSSGLSHRRHCAAVHPWDGLQLGLFAMEAAQNGGLAASGKSLRQRSGASIPSCTCRRGTSRFDIAACAHKGGSGNGETAVESPRFWAVRAEAPEESVALVGLSAPGDILRRTGRALEPDV